VKPNPLLQALTKWSVNKYRWIMLVMACLLSISLGCSHFLIPSLAYRLFSELRLTHAQFTLIFVAPTLVSTFTAMPGGALADQYGVKPIIAIGAFLAVISSFARVLTPNFNGMFALMCLLGISLGFVIPNLPKLVSVWFPPKEVPLANCCLYYGFCIWK